jgi:hypothetical protein
MNKQFFIDHSIDPDETFFPEEEESWLSRSDAHLSSPYGMNYSALTLAM